MSNAKENSKSKKLIKYGKLLEDIQSRIETRITHFNAYDLDRYRKLRSYLLNRLLKQL